MKIKLLLFVLVMFGALNVGAQCPGWSPMTLRSEWFSPLGNETFTKVKRDVLGRPFVYTAQMQGGLEVYNISDSTNLQSIGAILVPDFNGLHPVNLVQDSIFLYATLGNTYSKNQASGLAIINVVDPNNPVLLDVYTHSGRIGGTADVKIKGDYAYLGAMKNGLVVLDISDKSNITLESELQLSMNFPLANIDSAYYNARGIDIKGDLAYVCYERGSLRVIDISNPAAPVQVSQYDFDSLNGYGLNYLDIVIDGNLAFVTIDNNGVEVLDISDPMNIVQTGWWRPSTWPGLYSPGNPWGFPIGNAQEIVYDKARKRILFAAGRTDLVAVDVSDPANPVTCGTYGNTADNYGTAAVDIFEDKVYLTYRGSILYIPFSSFNGFRELNRNDIFIVASDEPQLLNFEIYPNPSNGKFYLTTNNSENLEISVFNILGKSIPFSTQPDGNRVSMSLETETPGIYFVVVGDEKGSQTIKLVVE